MRRCSLVHARLVHAVLVAALALAALPGAGPAAAAGAPQYVALGDSYSSGTGTGRFLADGTACQRSAASYPALVASARGYALDLRACAGATTADVARLQLGSLGTATAHVTLTAGGNDAGFAAVLTECAKPAWMSDCGAAVDRARAIIRTALPGRLSSLHGAVRSRAPQARVVVVGYPRVFGGVDCNAATWFSPAEMASLDATADLLNATAATAAAGAGVTFRNPTPAFLGHAVCGSPEWINGLSSPTSESYHPNRAGHASGYAPLVGTAVSGAAVAVTSGVVQAAEASAEELAARQRPHAVRDRSVLPARFTPPDLTSAEARQAAGRAGVDLDDPASVAAADRRVEAAQARAARDGRAPAGAPPAGPGKRSPKHTP